MKVLSLFDGMACGMLAMQKAGIEVDRYVAFEIDKYATQTSSHNFPMIEHRGDVFQADFTEFSGFDFLIGGSPCTYWSIAQTKNRETVASGMGWELFSQYVRALHEAKPKYFIYENNKSMSKDIRASIDEAFGFEAVLINSALVSAQNRQRLYWVGKRNADGTYSKVNVEQPADRGILLRDILETGVCWRDKSYTLDANYYKGGNLTSLEKQSGKRLMAAEPLITTPDGKSFCITATEYKGSNPQQTLTKHRRTMVAEPVNMTKDGKAQCLRATYYKDGIRNMVGNTVDRKTCVAEPIRIGTIENDSKNHAHDSQQYRVYSPDGKGVTLCGNGGGLGAKTGLYAVPAAGRIVGRRINEQGHRNDYNEAIPHFQYFEVNENPQKTNCLTTVQKDNMIAVPVEPKSGRSIPVYEVRNGLITIKGKQYPIKLQDGYYIIRKLTVRECMRLQTVPEWYDFPVSDSQAYKMLGNGWTVLVISHLIKSSLV